MNCALNDETYAVISDDKRTKIVEKNREYYINNDAYSVMDESCKYYGSTYLGRLEACKLLLNCSYKVPIIVEESNVLIFFPIKSSLDKDCCWINPNSIYNIEKIGDNAIVTFKNGKKKEFKVSKYSLENQIYKCAKLESILFRRKR